MELPKISPLVVRAEDEPGYQKEIWQPTWNCFCCQDTGIVRPHLARLVIDGYDWNIHKLPACRNSKCNAATKFSDPVAMMTDSRLTATICQQLDQLSREDWKQTTQLKHETLQKLADSKSLRTRERTSEEEEIAKERKRVVEEEMEF